ncbi:hypothetical protein A0H81_14857 [Grifola frondosa]|uniref:Uncharacterized protein n=1 Tax=Grifola frondosa TaxID=5627 RepID=A0A1C7LMK6_GRIFR|nr:hypothetical protein A0H81_14857 [Grifola frondosa]
MFKSPVLVATDMFIPGASALNAHTARPRHWAASAFLSVLGTPRCSTSWISNRDLSFFSQEFRAALSTLHLTRRLALPGFLPCAAGFARRYACVPHALFSVPMAVRRGVMRLSARTLVFAAHRRGSSGGIHRPTVYLRLPGLLPRHFALFACVHRRYPQCVRRDPVALDISIFDLSILY